MADPLTPRQLAMINTLLYARDPHLTEAAPGSYHTLGEFMNDISPENTAERSITVGLQDWIWFAGAVKRDGRLRDMRIIEPYYDPVTGSSRVLLEDPATGQAYVVFEGSGHGEWADNAEAAGYTDNPLDPTLSVLQQEAVDYIAGLGDGYGPIIVSGHSKGGNKAKAAALLCGNVSRCVSFDGQGFSDEFFARHADDIARNQHKIHNYNCADDYVNELLNDVGDTRWYKAHRTGMNPLSNHDPMTMFDENGDMTEVADRSRLIAELDYMINSFLRSEGKYKQDSVRSAMELLDIMFGTGRDRQGINMIRFLSTAKNRDFVRRLFAYTVRFANLPFVRALCDLLKRIGLGMAADMLFVAYNVPNGEDLVVDPAPAPDAPGEGRKGDDSGGPPPML